jgi:hypothetical protein
MVEHAVLPSIVAILRSAIKKPPNLNWDKLNFCGNIDRPDYAGFLGIPEE